MSDSRTLGNMEARTIRELARDGLTADVRDAFATAVDFYRHDRFFFNEEEATAVMTVGQDVYDLPSDYLALDEIHLEDTAGQKYELNLVDYKAMDAIQTQTNSFPEVYAIYRDQIFIRPPTNRALSMRMSYLKDIELSASSTSTLSNAWTTDAEELIRSHAKADIYEHRLHNPTKAASMAAFAKRAWARLRKRTIGHIDTTKIRKTRF